MIKNEKQYNTSKKRLAEFELSIASKQPKVLPNSKEEGALNSLIRIKNDIKEEIKDEVKEMMKEYENQMNIKGGYEMEIDEFELLQDEIDYKKKLIDRSYFFDWKKAAEEYLALYKR